MINILNQLNQSHKILIVEPHPDDACLGCHYLINHCMKLNIPATLYTVTRGEAAYGYNSSTLANTRAKETQAYSDAFKLRQIQRDWPDGSISTYDILRSTELSLYSKLHCFIRNDEYTHVFTTPDTDKHPDHAYVGTIIKQLSEALSNTQFYYHDSTTPLTDFTHYIALDRQSELNLKSQVMQECYPSQVKLCPTFTTGFTGLAAYRGMQVSAYAEYVEYAEVYKLVS